MGGRASVARTTYHPNCPSRVTRVSSGRASRFLVILGKAGIHNPPAAGARSVGDPQHVRISYQPASRDQLVNSLADPGLDILSRSLEAEPSGSVDNQVIARCSVQQLGASQDSSFQFNQRDVFDFSARRVVTPRIVVGRAWTDLTLLFWGCEKDIRGTSPVMSFLKPSQVVPDACGDGLVNPLTRASLHPSDSIAKPDALDHHIPMHGPFSTHDFGDQLAQLRSTLIAKFRPHCNVRYIR